MKHRQRKLKQNRTLPIILIIALAAAFTSVIVYRNHTTASQSSDQGTDASKRSLFSFDAKAAPGWWQGATNETSIAVFGNDEMHGCFVSAEYKKDTIDADVEINRINTELTRANGGYVVTPLESHAVELQTNSEPLPYELRQSSVSNPQGAEKLKGGQEFGFAQLSNGYIKITGYCDTPEQLSGTLPSLDAIKFDDTRLKDL